MIFDTLTSGYDYVVVGDNIGVTAGSQLRFVARNSGTDITSGSINLYFSAGHRLNTSSGAASVNEQSGTYATVADFDIFGTAYAGSLKIEMINPARSANTQQAYSFQVFGMSDGSNPVHETRLGIVSAGGAVTGLKLFASASGTITGTFNLYKIARS